MKRIWNWICSLFTKENIGIIWRTIFSTAKNSVTKTIHDPNVQAAAFNFAKDMLFSDMTGEEKKAVFNTKMTQYLKSIGMEVGTSTLNVLREIAVEAAKESEGIADSGTCISCAAKTVGLVLFAVGMSMSVSASTQVHILKAGANYGYAGRMTGWEAVSTNATATVTLNKVTDIYAKRTASEIVTNWSQKVEYVPRNQIVTNITYTYANPVSASRVVTTNSVTVWSNGLHVVDNVYTNYTKYATTNTVYNISTNVLQSMLITKVPVTNAVTVTRMVLLSSVTNSILSSTLENGFKSGGQSANISPIEYLLVGGTIVEDENMKFIMFMGDDAAVNSAE